MNKVNHLLTKYKTLPKEEKKYKRIIIKFSPTDKWVEYSLDLIDAKRLLQTVDFVSRFELLNVIKKIESKVEWHEKHADFNLQAATRNLRTARRLLQM